MTTVIFDIVSCMFFTVCGVNCSSISVSQGTITLEQLSSSILSPSIILSLVVRVIVEKPCSSEDAISVLLLELNDLPQTVPVVKWINVIVVAIWRLYLIALIPHLNQNKLNVQTVLEVYWIQVPVWLLTQILCVPTAVSLVSISLKHYWNKTASFEVLNRFKCYFFPFWSSVCFLTQKSTFTLS